MWVKLLLIILPLLLLPVIVVAQSFQPDDILVGSGGGISQYRAGTYLRSLITGAGPGSVVNGLCFSTNGKYLYATSTIGSMDGRVSRFDSVGSLLNSIWGQAAFPANDLPASCVSDAFGNVYVGTDTSIRKYVPGPDGNGNLVTRYYPEANHRFTGIDLGPDQCSLWYPSAGKVKRFNVCNNQPLPDFADLTNFGPGQLTCSVVRIRSNGEVLAACNRYILRLGSDGRVIRGYEASYCQLDHPGDVAPFAGVNFASDGTSLWAALHTYGALVPSRMCKLNIETGQFVTFFNAAGLYSAGVYRERTAATTQCSDGIDNNNDGRTDYPDDPLCQSPTGDREMRCFTWLNRTMCLVYYRRLVPYLRLLEGQ
jgi:hypothetical protein